MNKEKIKEVLECLAYNAGESRESCETEEEHDAELTAFIDNALTAIESLMPSWVPCSERLPEMNIPVLGYNEKLGELWIVFRGHDDEIGDWNWFFVYANRAEGCGGPLFIDWWHPLPLPPAEKEQP